MDNEPLATLCHAWQTAKHAENAARLERVEIEKEIYKSANVKEGGTAKTVVGDYAVTITTNNTLKIDESEWFKVAHLIPVHLSPIREKLSVDRKAFNELKKYKPELIVPISSAITSSPSKPTFKIEAIL